MVAHGAIFLLMIVSEIPLIRRFCGKAIRVPDGPPTGYKKRIPPAGDSMRKQQRHAAKTTLLPRKRCGGTSPRCIGRVPRGLRADETVRPIAAREPCSAARSRRSFTKRSALLSRDAFRVLFPSLPSGIPARSMRRFCPQFRASFGTHYSIGQNSLSSKAKRWYTTKKERSRSTPRRRRGIPCAARTFLRALR